MKGWTKFKDEFNEIFRGLTQLGYAVFFIGHDKETISQLADGTSTKIIRPALSNSTREVITGMADIYGYAHQPGNDRNTQSILTLRDPSGTMECGCRFKYIDNEFTLSYENLVNALNRAIDKEAAEHDGKFVTNEKINTPVLKEYNFNDLMTEFKNIVANIPGSADSNAETEDGKKFKEFWAPSITRVVERNLGKGKKIGNATADQAEMVALIVEELKELTKIS